jgi:hypothetical protein
MKVYYKKELLFWKKEAKKFCPCHLGVCRQEPIPQPPVLAQPNAESTEIAKARRPNWQGFLPRSFKKARSGFASGLRLAP